MATGTANRQAVFSWLNAFLRDKGLQFTQSGFKGGADMGKHTVDLATGYWEKPQYSATKPPRWLFNIDLGAAGPSARLPAEHTEINIGHSNTAQGDKAGLAVRILPLIRIGPNAYQRVDDFEANVLFIFHGPVEAGSSSDAFTFNPTTGGMRRGETAEPYIFAALLGLRPPSDTITVDVNGIEHTLSYGDLLTALRNAIRIHLKNGTVGKIPVYDLSDDANATALRTDIENAWNAAGPLPAPAAAAAKGDDVEDENEAGEIDLSTIEIPEHPELIGIDPAVYRQINALLRTGKQHLILYGPPGTGKTELARWIASSLPGGQWTLVTGSSDWSSQDIIGGYQPVGDGNVEFVPGILLRAFDQPLIIDELNRCDIDKVIGPLFTVLSGQQTTLPYRTDLTDKGSQPYVILPKPKANAAPHEYAPGPRWRLIATINSIDKASLYQMSYALSRRFGWVYVDAPTDLAGFIAAFIAKLEPGLAPPPTDMPCPLAAIWAAINESRPIGAAPIIDAIRSIRELAPGSSFFGPADAAMKSAVLDAFDMALLPLLDGIVLQDAQNIADAIISALALAPAEAERVTGRLRSVAI